LNKRLFLILVKIILNRQRRINLIIIKIELI